MTPSRILVVDDTPSNVKLLADVLGAKGYTVLTAASGAEALEAIERHAPDLVLLDVMMPGGSGLTVLEHVRNAPELKETPVVVISAFAADRDHLAAFEAGASGFLKKPFDPDELESLVNELLGRD